MRTGIEARRKQRKRIVPRHRGFGLAAGVGRGLLIADVGSRNRAARLRVHHPPCDKTLGRLRGAHSWKERPGKETRE